MDHLQAQFHSHCSPSKKKSKKPVKQPAFAVSKSGSPKKSAKGKTVLSPPHLGPLFPASTIDVALMPDEASLTAVPILGTSFTTISDMYASPSHSPKSHTLASPQASFSSLPEPGGKIVFKDPWQDGLAYLVPENFGSDTFSPSLAGLDDVFAPTGESQTRENALTSNANEDASFATTGFTLDEIMVFRGAPDASDPDQRWICRFPGCGERRFLRAENIKSHIQTHLGDRRYSCTECTKRFVRQNDLKRHVGTHSGEKPYPCACGSRFVRVDALTRHRQRGVCAGAFEGVVKKVTKRGRPPKNRPEMDEGRKKAVEDHLDAVAMSASSSSSGVTSASFPEYAYPPAAIAMSATPSSSGAASTPFLECIAMSASSSSTGTASTPSPEYAKFFNSILYGPGAVFANLVDGHLPANFQPTAELAQMCTPPASPQKSPARDVLSPGTGGATSQATSNTASPAKTSLEDIPEDFSTGGFIDWEAEWDEFVGESKEGGAMAEPKCGEVTSKDTDCPLKKLVDSPVIADGADSPESEWVYEPSSPINTYWL